MLCFHVQHTGPNEQRLAWFMERTQKYQTVYRWWQVYIARVELVHPSTVKLLTKTAEPKQLSQKSITTWLTEWLGNVQNTCTLGLHVVMDHVISSVHFTLSWSGKQSVIKWNKMILLTSYMKSIVWFEYHYFALHDFALYFVNVNRELFSYWAWYELYLSACLLPTIWMFMHAAPLANTHEDSF